MGQGSVHVRLVGPSVQGYATPIVDRMLAEATAEVADYARFQVMLTEEETFVNPTGYYTSQTQLEQLGPYMWSVNDGGVVYGPWLEGIGSRNRPRPGFPGYRIYQRTKNSIAQKSQAIVEAWTLRTVGHL